MGSRITHFSWPDAGLCEVPSKPTLARAKGVARYMCVFQCGHIYSQGRLCCVILNCVLSVSFVRAVRKGLY